MKDHRLVQVDPKAIANASFALNQKLDHPQTWVSLSWGLKFDCLHERTQSLNVTRKSLVDLVHTVIEGLAMHENRVQLISTSTAQRCSPRDSPLLRRGPLL